ncbi:MAG TPA: TadE/TadG family type IV pilus assembly protein [Chloroflexota bacterium]|nr:TadE/TadG family type IV pilus assembly protein [Chloroflexota bacterium]
MSGGRRRGQSALEFALMLPALLLILGGTIQFGQAFLAYAQLMQAAQEGARYGAVLPYTRNDAAITARAQQVAPGGTNDTVTVTSTVSATNSTPVTAANRTRGNVLTVNVRHTQPLAIPFFPVASLPLSATASMVVEQTP